jgi:prepilin-type N-terminal cleavage/methylation domain-containing protein
LWNGGIALAFRRKLQFDFQTNRVQGVERSYRRKTMGHNAICKNIHNGFTLMELMITIAILGLLISIAIPAYSSWLPSYRLKSAVHDLYSNMYQAKMMAIKENDDYRLIFTTMGDDCYFLERPDGSFEKEIYLSDYGSMGNITFGCGNATKKANSSGSPVEPDYDGVSYNSNKATFNSMGLGSSGYVYLANSKGTAYAVGTWSSGVIVLKKWDESTGSWN